MSGVKRENWSDEKLFDRLLHNTSSRTYWENVVELRSRANQYVFKRSIDLVRSDNIKERILGVDLLSQLGSPPRKFYKETINLYFELLRKEHDPGVLRAVLHGIAQNNHALSQAQISSVAALKDSSHAGIRAAVGHALLCLNNEIAIDTQIFLSCDKVIWIRDWATFALGTQLENNTRKIREALWRRVEDPDQNTRLEAIVGLAIRKDKRIKAIVKREFDGGEYGKLLFEAIAELKDRSYLPSLKAEMRQSKDDVGVSPEWLEGLKSCIEVLEQLPKVATKAKKELKRK